MGRDKGPRDWGFSFLIREVHRAFQSKRAGAVLKDLGQRILT